MKTDYSIITELPCSKVLPIQIERSLSRYLFGSQFCNEKNVLEIACGGGQGLGLLSKNGKFVVGADYEPKNLTYANQTYKNRSNIALVRLDAHELPFKEQSFDVILIYEAIYYLKKPELFFCECNRVLSKNGILIICTANKDWPNFNPSVYSYHYFSVPELDNTLKKHGFKTEFFGAFPDIERGIGDKFKSLIKKIAVKLHLIPESMKGKALLKKLFFGKLCEMPAELTPTCAPYSFPIAIPSNQIDNMHTAIYAVAKKN